MAKVGIDSFLLDCHTNDNMAEIEAAYGIKGFAVIVKLWQKIYSDKGYYCEWNERSPLLFLAQWFGGNSGADLNLIIEVVNHAIKIGIFNESMFNKYAVLTSERIQKQYFEVVKRRTEIKVINEYLLVSVGKNAVIVNINGENVCRNQKNVCRNSTSKVKESKVKESKDNSEVANYFQNATLNQTFLDYLSYKEEKSGPVSGIQISYILQELEQLGADDEEKIAIIKQSITKGWSKLYPLSRAKPKTKKVKFEQRKRTSKEFEDLEKKIMAVQDAKFDKIGRKS